MPHARTIVVGLAAVLASLAFVPSASAHHGCAAHARGGKITHKTREAHVFVKNKWRYGCASRVGRIHRLPGLDNTDAGDFGDGRVPILTKLNGVFVAYGRYTLYPAGGAGDTQVDLLVVDLRTGKTVAMEPATDLRPGVVDSILERFVLKRNGSIAWIGRATSYGDMNQTTTTYEVHRFSTEPATRGEVELDEGGDISPDVLTLSDDRRTVSWQRGGQPKSAPLP